jgi:hypothetical protein
MTFINDDNHFFVCPFVHGKLIIPPGVINDDSHLDNSEEFNNNKSLLTYLCSIKRSID